jgi:hypothetical protein
MKQPTDFHMHDYIAYFGVRNQLIYPSTGYEHPQVYHPRYVMVWFSSRNTITATV